MGEGLTLLFLAEQLARVEVSHTCLLVAKVNT